jgi:hypothetical protein
MRSINTAVLIGSAVGIWISLTASSASAGFGTAYSATSRGQGLDDNPQRTPTTYKPIGGSGTGTAGVCYMTKVTGSFRGDGSSGAGEYAVIGVDSSGFYYLEVQSDTAYGGGNNVGPQATMNCINTTQIGIPAGHLNNFSTTLQTEMNTFGHGNILNTNSNHWIPWSGVRGYMLYSGAGAKSDVVSASFLGILGAAQSYPVGTCGVTPECQLTTYGWDTGSSGTGQDFAFDATFRDWECDLNDADGDGGPTCQLASGYSASSPTSICWLSSIKGYWNSQASAKIVGSGTHWELDMAGDTNANATWASATCMTVPQTGL